MIFRKANMYDTGQLVELRKKQLIDEGGFREIDIDEELTNYFKANIENGNLIIWVANENNKIIATSGVCFYQLPPSFSNPTGKVAYITNIYTSNAYRKQGIATKMIGCIIEEIKKKECKVIGLHASSQGKTIYKKQGFSESSGYMFMKL